MFTKLHLLDNNSNASNDNEKSDWITNGEGVVDIGGFIFPGDDISGFDDVKMLRAQVSNAPMEQTMDQLKETMWNIIKDGTKGGVALCVHVTSLLKVVCANIRTNCLMRGNESLHLGNIFNSVEDDRGCFVKWRKDWHEWMVAHKFAYTSRVLNV
jgi:hypothetical protein